MKLDGTPRQFDLKLCLQHMGATYLYQKPKERQ